MASVRLSCLFFIFVSGGRGAGGRGKGGLSMFFSDSGSGCTIRMYYTRGVTTSDGLLGCC